MGNKHLIDQLCEKEQEIALLEIDRAALVGQIQTLERAIEEANERSADLEAFLFAFVWNRETFPLGRRLGKSEEEIADKTLEVVDCAKDMVDLSTVRRRLLFARQRKLHRADLEKAEGGERNESDKAV